MKVVQINAVCGAGSTGKICVAISELLSERNIENYILYSQGNSDYHLGIKYMSSRELKLQALLSRVLGNFGFNSRRATKRLIAHLERIQPDIVYMHNIHAHNCNLRMLFTYLKSKNIKIYWMFHDCWAFTGYCPHFDMIGCNKWQTECHHCPKSKNYSWLFDRSGWLYEQKKALCGGLDLTVVAPSSWLAELVKQSFYADYPVHVIYSGIDLDVFRPVDSSFRVKYGISADKKIVLGVAFGWGKAKGLDVFVELANRLDAERYQIVLVGTNECVDALLPSNIISIHRTTNQQELVEIYSAADVFANPTREEVLGLVNVEALACGIPVVAFRTGGCPEAIDESCGMIVDKDGMDAMEEAVRYVCEHQPFSKEACVKRAASFDKNDRFIEHLELLLKEEKL